MTGKIVTNGPRGNRIYGRNSTAKHLISLPDVEIVGVFDSVCSRAEALAGKYRVPPARYLRDLMQRAEAVVICVPTTAHYAVAAEAIRNGCHVFVEKPFTHTADEARSLCDLAEKYRVHIQWDMWSDFNPVIHTFLCSVHTHHFGYGGFHRYVPFEKSHP